MPKLDPFISQFVINEISVGDSIASKLRMDISRGIPWLEMIPDIAHLANQYFRAVQIPEKAKTDAFHLAIATWYGLDYMVSWNCTHIANGRVRKLVEQINRERNLSTPIICTPEELMEV